MPFDKIPPWLELPTGSEEEDTHFDGPFSYVKEYHAFTIGVAVGFASVTPIPKLRKFVYHAAGLIDEDGNFDTRSKAMREVRQEGHYAAGGVIVGALMSIAFQFMTAVGFLAVV